jgi:hypothetical protein
MCGKPGCENPAVIWLKLDEERQYRTGQRIFVLGTNTAKARVQ